MAICTTCGLLIACASQPGDPIIHQGGVKGAVAAAWSPGGSRLAVANSRRIWTYDARTLRGQKELFVARKTAKGFEFADRYGLGNSLIFLDEDRLATTGMGAMVSIWDTATGAKVESVDWPVDHGYPISLAWSAETGVLAAGTGVGAVILMRPGDNAEPEVLGPAGGQLHAIRFGADGDYLGTAGTGAEVVIWNLPSRSIYARIPTEGFVMDIEPVGTDGRFLVAGKELRIWSFTQSDEPRTLDDPSLDAQAAGYALASASLVAIAVLVPYNPAEMLIYGTPTPPNNAVAACGRAAAVDPAGTLAADMHPGYLKERIRIIDVAQGEVVQKLDPRGGRTCDLQFSPDGSRLLIANQRGGHVYDTAAWGVTRLKASYTRPD